MHGHRATDASPVTAGGAADGWPPLLVIHGDADPWSRRTTASRAQAWANAAGARPARRGACSVVSVTRRRDGLQHKGNTVATLVEVGRLAHSLSGGAANLPTATGRSPRRVAHDLGLRGHQFGA